MHYTPGQEASPASTLDDIYIGNGASELIVMAMQGAAQQRRRGADPDARLSAVDRGGEPVRRHAAALRLRRGERLDARPGRHRAARSRRARARIVVINPNNPTGALYSDELLREIIEIAREHDLIIFADEIYDKMLYDGATHTSIASLADDVLFVTFNGLSKNYRSCGYRAGWMVVSGEKKHAQDYIEGLNMLASMRLCSNVPGPVRDPDRAGRLPEHQRPGRAGRAPVQAARPGLRAAHRDPRRDLRQAQGRAVPVPAPRPEDLSDRGRPAVHPRTAARTRRCCWCRARGFNWPHPDHFRVVFLPNADDLTEAIGRIARSSRATANATARHNTRIYAAYYLASNTH